MAPPKKKARTPVAASAPAPVPTHAWNEEGQLLIRGDIQHRLDALGYPPQALGISLTSPTVAMHTLRDQLSLHYPGRHDPIHPEDITNFRVGLTAGRNTSRTMPMVYGRGGPAPIPWTLGYKLGQRMRGEEDKVPYGFFEALDLGRAITEDRAEVIRTTGRMSAKVRQLAHAMYNVDPDLLPVPEKIDPAVLRSFLTWFDALYNDPDGEWRSDAARAAQETIIELLMEHKLLPPHVLREDVDEQDIMHAVGAPNFRPLWSQEALPYEQEIRAYDTWSWRNWRQRATLRSQQG